MNINKVAIDTMGKADDPAIDKDIEREIFKQKTIVDLVHSGTLMEILVGEFGNESDSIEAVLFSIYENRPRSPLYKLLEKAIHNKAERITYEKYRD